VAAGAAALFARSGPNPALFCDDQLAIGVEELKANRSVCGHFDVKGAILFDRSLTQKAFLILSSAVRDHTNLRDCRRDPAVRQIARRVAIQGNEVANLRIEIQRAPELLGHGVCGKRDCLNAGEMRIAVDDGTKKLFLQIEGMQGEFLRCTDALAFSASDDQLVPKIQSRRKIASPRGADLVLRSGAAFNFGEFSAGLRGMNGRADIDDGAIL
jgi:hypothetical protein